MSNQAAQRKTTKGGPGGTDEGERKEQEMGQEGGMRWQQVKRDVGRAQGPRAAIIILHKKVN